MDGSGASAVLDEQPRHDVADGLDASVGLPPGSRPGKPQRPQWLDEELRREATTAPRKPTGPLLAINDALMADLSADQRREYEKLKGLCAELAAMKATDEAELAALRAKAEGDPSPETFEES